MLLALLFFLFRLAAILRRRARGSA